MRAHQAACLIVALAWTSACGVEAPPPDVQTPPPATPEPNTRARCLQAMADAPPRYEPVVRAFCSEHASLGGVGASLAIAERGALVFSGGFGRRCADAEASVDGETVYRVGSISKLMTAVIAAELARAAALELDAPVRALLPSYDPPAPENSSPTLRQLLLHRAGVPELADDDPALWRRGWLAVTREAPLEFAPGASRRYSNTGYYVVGEALTRAARQPYAALLERHVTAPFQLPRTTARSARVGALAVACDHDGPPQRRRAYAVTALTPNPARGDDWIVPAGGVLSTAEELVALALALPRAPSWPELSASSPDPGAPDKRAALTGRVRALPSGDMAFQTSGNTGAQASELHWVPARGFAVAVTANIGRPYRATVDAAYRVSLGERAYGP